MGTKRTNQAKRTATRIAELLARPRREVRVLCPSHHDSLIRSLDAIAAQKRRNVKEEG